MAFMAFVWVSVYDKLDDILKELDKLNKKYERERNNHERSEAYTGKKHNT